MQRIERETYTILKKSFDWLDSDKDEQISIKDIETSCGISTDEAKSLFESLSTNNESFIKFEEFCEGVLNFPSLIDQFKSDQERAERLSISSSSPLTQICEFFHIPPQPCEDDSIDLLSAQIFQIASFPKSRIIEIVQCLFTSFLNLQDFCKTLQEQQSCLNLEHSLQQESLLREKYRIEKMYNQLMEEFRQLEKEVKSLEEKVLDAKNEKRELKLKISHFQEEVKTAKASLDEMEAVVKGKEKGIMELNKKLQAKNTLVYIENLKKKENKRKEPNTGMVSKTPRGTTVVETEQKGGDSAKDAIIKNLKNQLEGERSRCQKLEERFVEMQNEKMELLEKLRIVSIRSRRVSENEEDMQLETLESLKDELYQLDSNFRQTFRASFRQFTNFKDFSMQVDRTVEKKKSRYSCFGFFS